MPLNNYWQDYTPTISLEGLAEFNKQKDIERQQAVNTLRQQILNKGKQIAEENVRDYLTESNDNVWVDYNYTLPKSKNSHLKNRAVEDAKSHNAWVKEHPVANAIGLGLGATPFAVASAPFIGSLASYAPAAASTLAPGSSFWMNPLTKQIVASTLGGLAVDNASVALSDNTIGENVRKVIGYQPSNEWDNLGYTLLTDAVNPGYYTSYGLASNLINNIPKLLYEETVKPGMRLFNSYLTPQNEGLIVSALTDYSKGVKVNYDLFKRFTDRGMVKEMAKNIKTPPNNIDLTSNILIDPDKRFMMFEPGKFFNYDIGAMSVEEIVHTFGPEAAYYKKLYDVAKAHNFEGKYAKIGQNAEYNILNRFAINKADPDVARGIAEARGIYDIPEYRARFNRWGSSGDTFVDDALARIDNVKLQGLSKELPINGQYGVHGGAYTSPDATTIGITNNSSSNWIADMIRHEANHVGHGLKRQPNWMRYHNEKIRPVIKEGKTTNTPLDKYYDEMDEIVERSKTAVEYANKIKKEGETLDQALTRLADMTEANIYNAEIPADIRQSIARYTKDSILEFWKNFVGGYATPISIGLTGFELFNNQNAFEEKVKKK